MILKNEFNGDVLIVLKQLYIYNQSKHLKLSNQLIFLLYLTILNVLIDCVCKVVLKYQPTTLSS